MLEATTHGIPPVRARLGFGLLGGALAWLAHLLLVWAISEFGCLGGLGEAAWLRLSGIAWLVVLVSFGTFGVALAATLVACGSRRRLGSGAAQPAGASGSELFLAQAGWITSGLFAVVILVETVPVLFYLHDC